MSVVVIGQIGRDLVLRTDGSPLLSESTTILQRDELLGGKGADQAVGLAQLGVPVALIGVVGDDFAGKSVLRQAEDDIDISRVVCRGTTALLIDIVGEPPRRLLLEHVPETSLVQVADLDQSSSLLDTADTVSIQLQQPAATVLAAAQRAQRRGLRVVADGAPPPGIRDELLSAVDAIRADATEAALIAGKEVTTVEQATKLANHLLKCGPKLAALAVPDVGDLLTWNGGSELFGFADVDVVDPTGAGDAFVAGLISALRDGTGPPAAAVNGGRRQLHGAAHGRAARPDGVGVEPAVMAPSLRLGRGLRGFVRPDRRMDLAPTLPLGALTAIAAWPRLGLQSQPWRQSGVKSMGGDARAPPADTPAIHTVPGCAASTPHSSTSSTRPPRAIRTPRRSTTAPCNSPTAS